MENLIQSPYLLIITSKGQRHFPLIAKSYWTVGRGPENDLVIADQCISRNHAILQSTGEGEFLLIDLGSRNGTFLNGRRVSIPVNLKNGDLVTFGKTETEFHFPKKFTRTIVPSTSTQGRENDSPTSVLHERRLTSVMVVDMRNFTVLARQLDEKILSELLGNWFQEAGNIVRYAGSWVDKYIGDAIMAIWFHGEEGVTQEDIFSIFQAISDLNRMTQRLSNLYPLPFELRVGAGVNTGYAMVGNTGSTENPDYTAIGEAVNTAFRLESATKEIGLDLAIGEKTYSHLIEIGKAQQLFKQYCIKLKGYEQPTTIYAINFDDLDTFLEADEEITEAIS